MATKIYRTHKISSLNRERTYYLNRERTYSPNYLMVIFEEGNPKQKRLTGLSQPEA